MKTKLFILMFLPVIGLTQNLVKDGQTMTGPVYQYVVGRENPVGSGLGSVSFYRGTDKRGLVVFKTLFKLYSGNDVVLTVELINHKDLNKVEVLIKDGDNGLKSPGGKYMINGNEFDMFNHSYVLRDTVEYGNKKIVRQSQKKLFIQYYEKSREYIRLWEFMDFGTDVRFFYRPKYY